MGELSGITFHHRDRYFEFVDLEWGSDNSFYFLPKQHEAEFGDRIVHRRNDDGSIVWHVDQVVSTECQRRKVSRHPSGFFHIKDVTGRGGRRERDGLRGLAFRQTSGFHTFLVMAPQRIETLPEVSSPNAAHIVTHLVDSIEPFTVQFSVWKKSVTVDFKTRPGELLGNGVITIAKEGHDYGLIVASVNLSYPQGGEKPVFPARTLVLAR